MKKIILFLFFGISALNINAQITLHVETAGTLPNLIAENRKYQITALTLTGELNGTDIRFIREMCGGGYYEYNATTDGQLEKLDLTNAKIVSGGNHYFQWYSDVDIKRFNRDPEDYRKKTKTNTISSSMFWNCRKLQYLNLPKNITSIEGSAFGLSGLYYIFIPQEVSKLGRNAFGNSRIRSIYISSKTPPAINKDTFDEGNQGFKLLFNKQDCELHVPKGFRDVYWLQWGFDNIVEE
jgi:hypothetical protein